MLVDGSNFVRAGNINVISKLHPLNPYRIKPVHEINEDDFDR